LTGVTPSAAAPRTETVVDIGDDDDDDDGLPSVGRVWEGPAPSLGAILKNHAAASSAAPAKPAAPPPSGPAASNVEPVSPDDLPAVWKAFLQVLAQHGPGLYSLLSHGRLVSIQDGRAVIRYGAQHETFVKMLDRNGKKDLVRDAITRVLRQSVGVKFEVDDAPAGEESVAGSAPRPRTGPPEVAPPAGPPPVNLPPPAPAAPVVKITPELIDSIRSAEPLVRALMDELGAQIVKVEKEGANGV
jgi:hypothetical protein